MRIMKIIFTSLFILIAGWAAAGTTDEATESKPPKNCLSLMSIDDLDIIDNQNIAFRMNNGDYYLNHLPNTCPMLDRYRVIMYKTPLSSLCSLDIINVLDPIGGGLQYYGSCGLGKFNPVSKEEIQQMKDQVKEKKTTK